MGTRRTTVLCTTALVLLAGPLGAQSATADQEVAEGVAATKVHDSDAARRHFEAALRLDSLDYDALWRLGAALIDIGKRTPDNIKNPERDSLYAHAETYARRAVAAKPDGADGHFMLAYALARTVLTKGIHEKIHAATEIRYEAIRALELNPHHDGAYHILGRWNAEIERLSSFDRFLARTFLGASILNQASWDEAERNLRLAVQYAPANIYHHFDLAQVLVDRDKWAEAKEQLDLIATLPANTPGDANYKAQAAKLDLRVKEKLHS
ncbi:MAG TPA: hypothetical protein VHW65_02175 [Gemmatimonadales bacterium]|nr:hypothetical protein [Gemmatimonadales bacterium]